MGSAKTSFTFSTEPLMKIDADALIIPVFKKAASEIEAAQEKTSITKATSKEKATASKVSKKASTSKEELAFEWPVTLLEALQKNIETIAVEEKFDGGKDKILVIRTLNLTGQSSAALKVKRIVLLGLGQSTQCRTRYWENQVQKAASTLLGLKSFHTLAILLPIESEKLTSESIVFLAVDAFMDATYRSMETKEAGPDLKNVMFVLNEKSSAPKSAAASLKKLEAILIQAQVMAEARSLVKDLVNHPANLKTTDTLVAEAKTIGKQKMLQTTIQNDVAWIEKNMPCFYTVARGSLATDPPKWITVRFTPKGKVKKRIALVGKSVIFDTGGYQVKPGDYMVTMKGDMTGGAVVLAAINALGQLQPEHIEVTAYLAATPNKIDSDAMIPDSIVNTTCGKKVEIRHTDAEGRLTLIDAVAKAVEDKADEIITIATLTGSASQAVGHCIALMSNQDDFRNRVEKAAKTQGEPIQTLDVLEEDYDNIKSKLDGADIINTSQKKTRGAQSAAAFVMSGAPSGGKLPMAHLDIAGGDMTPDEKATGISVKAIIQYLLDEEERAANA